MKSLSRIGVFCSSRSDIDKQVFACASVFAQGLAKRNLSMVYGGAQVGLMGHLANECLSQGVVVYGVIPRCLDTVEVAHTGIQHLEKVEDLFDRKRRMLELADHFVIFPGGIGTLDELLEVITWKVLGQWNGEVIFYNLNGFWDSFLALLHELGSKNFLGEETFSQYRVCDSMEAVLEVIDSTRKNSL